MRDKAIIISITAALIIFLGYVAHIQYFRTREHVIGLYSQKQITLALQAAVSLESYIRERSKAIEVLADMPGSKNTQRAQYMTEYKRTYEKISGFEYIINIDREGVVAIGYPDGFPCPAKQDERVKDEFFKAFRTAAETGNSAVFSKNVLIDGKVFICIITPVFSDTGALQGAIVGILDVKRSLKSALKPIVYGDNDYAWIVNEEGVLLYHPLHEDMLLRNVFENDSQCIQCHQDFNLERRMTQTFSGFGIKFNKATPRQLVGYSRVELGNIQWRVAVSSPFFAVTRAVRNQFKNSLLLILFMMAAIMLGAYLFYKVNTTRLTAKKELEKLKMKTRLTEEKEAAESRYRVLVEQSPDPIFICTRKGFIMVNRSFEKLFGYSEQEVCAKGFSMLKLVAPESIDQFNKEIQAFIIARKPISAITIGLINKQGQSLEVEISLGRFMLGRKLVYQGIIHDITRTKQLEREKERRKHLAVIGEMSARIAHEIKNPLASIQMGIQLLESRVDGDAKQKSYYEKLRGEIHRVDSILKGLLNYAREDHLNLKSVSIQALLDRFKQLIQPSLNEHQIGLEISIDKNVPAVRADEQKIEQVLWNVVLNAIQASETGKKIELRVTRRDNGVQLRIEDQGSGIDANQMKKIFSPFYSTRTQGSGLGLAITSKIIEMHDGTISIESEPGKGTTVTILLPTEDNSE